MAKQASRSGQTKVDTASAQAQAPAAPASAPAQDAAAPAAVKMDVLRSGSYNGTTYHAGDTFDADEAHVDVLHQSGFAARADRVQAGQAARSDEQKAKDQESLYKGTNNPGPAKPLTAAAAPATDAAAKSGKE